jgi:hypothetical protein
MDNIEVFQRVEDFLTSGKEPASKYPGVTRVLSGTQDQTALLEWRRRVGEAEADRIVQESCSIGNSLDALVQKHFTESNFKQENYKSETGYDLYRQLKKPLADVEPCALQLKVWSDKLRVMGYLDILGLYKGQLSVMDVKNTRTTKRKEYVEDYFLQTTIYSLCLYDLLGIEVKQIVLLIADRSNTVPQIFIERTKNHVRTSINRIKAYHQAQEIQAR